MPRQPRIDLSGVPQHLVQRGNDRRPCFFRAHRPHALPRQTARCRFPTRLRRTRLCADDQPRASAADTRGDRLRQRHDASLGRRYVRYINDRYRRTGTLWEGRFKACPVQSDDHLLRCYRYIELNPVRARMVSQASDYAWSSYAANAHGGTDPLVSPHPQYLTLDAEDTARQRLYRDWVQSAIAPNEVAPDEVDEIRRRLQCQHAFGTERFRQMIEEQLQRRAGPAKIGRPRKSAHHAPADAR